MSEEETDKHSKLTTSKPSVNYDSRNKSKAGLSVEIVPKKSLVFGRKLVREPIIEKQVRSYKNDVRKKQPQVSSKLSSEEESRRRKALDLARSSKDNQTFFQNQPPKIKTREEQEKAKQEELLAKKEESLKKAKDLAAKESSKTSSSTYVKKAEKVVIEDQSSEVKKKKKDRLKSGDDSFEDKKTARMGKLTISKALDSEVSDNSPLEGRRKSLAALKRKREKEKLQQIHRLSSKEKVVKIVTLPDFLTVAELANRMAERSGEVVKVLMKLGVIVRPSQEIDAETAEIVVSEFGHSVKRVSESSMEEKLFLDDLPDTESRSAVITIMGHVDHGKTSLLDTIRKSNIADKEAGKITQHIGAYQITNKSRDLITFIDTPGHSAFTSMRARGADITDIVILVVDAKEGVLPQTVEAINHAKAAKKPIIVALNKVDLPEADPTKVKRQLLESGIIVEELGGDVISVEVSAKSGLGIDKLLESISLLAEIMELKANSKKRGSGIIIESNLDKGRGIVATVLVQNGTLKKGDYFVVTSSYGKVRTMQTDNRSLIQFAGPSTPVEITGLQGEVLPGDRLIVVENEAKAKSITEYRQQQVSKRKNLQLIKNKPENIFSNVSSRQFEDLALIIKADVQGSLQAITDSIKLADTGKINLKIIHKGIGAVTESDIDLMAPLRGFIISFNINNSRAILEIAKKNKVEIKSYSLIYELIEYITKIIDNLGLPAESKKIIGSGRVKEVFDVGKVGKIAGCAVDSGLFRRSARVRVLRNDTEIFAGKIKQLKSFKDDVNEVKSGSECGLAIENFEEILAGDTVECYDVVVREKLI